MKAIITLSDINALARTCHADESIAASLIAEAERQDIKPKIGDALYLQITRDEVPAAYDTLLDGGEWQQRDGTVRYLTGLRTALAYYAYARIIRDGNIQSTRFGAVIKTEDNSAESERAERQRQYREAFTTADGYMSEVMEYLSENAEAFGYVRKTMRANRCTLRVIDGTGSPRMRDRNDTPIVIDGQKGDKGDKGDTGDSAYQSWLNAYQPEPGHDTEEDFINWLQEPANAAAKEALLQATYAKEQGDKAKQAEQETTRKELQRQSAESARAEAEKSRDQAETSRVSEFGRLKTESETATASANAAATNANEAAAEAREVSDRVSSLERDLGQYEPLPSVAMTAETTGKYINADGEFVDDADFNIASVGAVVVGNTYELYMGGSDKMKPGVALFVARIKTTTTSGTERVEYLPLFSAMSTDIAQSGYVCFEAMEAYSDVLVCYRADVPQATTLLVRRYGTKASIATQINNLRKKVDLKSFADGYYESMRVGTADNLTSKGDATEEVIMSRRAGGDNQIEDGSASIKRIKGYSVVMNQQLEQMNFSNTITDTRTFFRYYIQALNADIKETILYRKDINTQKQLLNIVTVPSDTTDFRILHNGAKENLIIFRRFNTSLQNHTLFFRAYVDSADPTVVDGLKLSNIMLFDLTQMFGSGNEPTTPDDFAKRLGYDSIDDVPYIPYNEGEIVSSFAEGIKTTDTEGKVNERKWSETLKKYFPDGLKSAGSEYDEITPTKAVKRVKYRRLTGANTESWTLYGTTNEYGINNFLISIPDLVPKTLPGFISTYATRQNSLIANTTTEGYFPQSNKTCFFRIQASKAANVQDFRTFLANNPIDICYELATPEETAYDELNLTEQVAEGGTEEAIITEGKTSTPLRADIVYPIDAYNTIKANKTNIGTLSSLNTASKTDLVSAINELVGKVGSAADDVASLQSGLSSVETAASTNRADLDRTMSRVAYPDDRALPLLCGQPPILFGAGTPKESIVPDNWNQYDPTTGEGYNWNGKPSAIGQQYVDTTAASGGRYIAVRDGEWDLKWINS
mgnify:CR=1 FL=1